MYDYDVEMKKWIKTMVECGGCCFGRDGDGSGVLGHPPCCRWDLTLFNTSLLGF